MQKALKNKVTMIGLLTLLLMLGGDLTIRAEKYLNDGHPGMEAMQRDCESLSKDLKEMFEQLNKVESSKPTEEQMAEKKKHQEMMKKVLHEMTLHMEAEAIMLGEFQEKGLGHEGHHTP